MIMTFRLNLIVAVGLIFILAHSPAYSETVQSCHQKVMDYVLGLGRTATESDILTAMEQCDDSFTDVEALAEQCKDNVTSYFKSLGRPPTASELSDAIAACEAMVKATVEASIPDPCENGPAGFEDVLPEQYADLFDSGNQDFIDQFTTICEEQSEKIKNAVFEQKSAEFSSYYQKKYSAAIDTATQNNWVVNSDGLEIKYLTEGGVPTYNITTSKRNYESAKQAGTDTLWSDFSGQNMTIGIWDAGQVYSSHNDYLSRTTWQDVDNSNIDYHATHVAGTLVGNGNNNSEAKGMAPSAIVYSYNWNNNISELFDSAASSADSNGLLLSNHSYGLSTGWTYYPFGIPGNTHLNWMWEGLDCEGSGFCDASEDYKHGLYNIDAQQLDYTSYLLPYHLIAKAAGNNASEGPESGTAHLTWFYNNGWQLIETSKSRPIDCGQDNGFDCLMPDSTAKNIITVGAIDSSNNIASFSSRGPTDDGRIKPDIVAAGVDVTSTWINGSYSDLNGTSMATPVVAGSLLLLQEKFKSLNNNNAMRAATLKALAIHTADDLGNPGPDYTYGWGKLNSKLASSLIDSSDAHQIVELRLNNNKQYTTTFTAQSSSPLFITLSWTDYPGTTHEEKVDPTDIVLINDLDLRVSGNDQSYKPWKMNVNQESENAGTGDNSRDNVEQIVIDKPIAGETYTITISHKDSLINDPILNTEDCFPDDTDTTNPHQCFSLIISHKESKSNNTDSSSTETSTTESGISIDSSGNIVLTLPVLTISGNNYAASFQFLAESSPLQFKLIDFQETQASSDVAAELNITDLSITIPKLSISEQTWELNLQLNDLSSLSWSLGSLIEK